LKCAPNDGLTHAPAGFFRRGSLFFGLGIGARDVPTASFVIALRRILTRRRPCLKLHLSNLEPGDGHNDDQADQPSRNQPLFAAQADPDRNGIEPRIGAVLKHRAIGAG
jgi:hypothetical protein